MSYRRRGAHPPHKQRTPYGFDRPTAAPLARSSPSPRAERHSREGGACAAQNGRRGAGRAALAEADAAHHAHAPAENTSSPCSGSPRRRKRGPAPAAAGCGRSSHLSSPTGAIVAFMLVFLVIRVSGRAAGLERMRGVREWERCDYAATTFADGVLNLQVRDCFCRAGSARQARAGGRTSGSRRTPPSPEGHVAQRRVGAGPGGSYR